MKGLAETARAFATFSLVPYLGIIFCPAAVVIGAIGIIKSHSSPSIGDSSRTIFYVSTIVGIGVLGIQVWFWWILYHVPAWLTTMGQFD